MHTLTFLIGASGAGKTTMARLLAAEQPVIVGDDLGVPSVEEMVQTFGSTDAWQRERTRELVQLALRLHPGAENVLLDVQTRPAYIEEACAAEELTTFRCILVDCSDEVRRERLVHRGQPELANDDMLAWARYLRRECLARAWPVLDTSALTPAESTAALRALLT